MQRVIPPIPRPNGTSEIPGTKLDKMPVYPIAAIVVVEVLVVVVVVVVRRKDYEFLFEKVKNTYLC